MSSRRSTEDWIDNAREWLSYLLWTTCGESLNGLTKTSIASIDFCTSKMYNLHVQKQIRDDR